MLKGKSRTLIIIVALTAVALVAFLALGSMLPRKYIVCRPAVDNPATDMPALMPLIAEVLRETQINFEYRQVPFELYRFHLLKSKDCDVLIDLERSDVREETIAFSDELKDGFYFGFRKEDTGLRDKVNKAISQVK